MRSLTIKIPNVSESLESKLEGLILGGAFWPDQPLASERRLSEEFAVSRTSMRFALANLCETGLLRVNKRHHVTNVMSDLLCPGFLDVALENPHQLLEYWLLLFHEAVKLAKIKSRNSDLTLIQKFRGDLQRDLVSASPDAIIHSFNGLTRSVLDSCYNFFLSQTHHALFLVAAPYFQKSLGLLAQKTADDPNVLKLIGGVAEFKFDVNKWKELLESAFVPTTSPGSLDSLSNGMTADGLTQVILRHSFAFESVYELRLITEKHAAFKAAKNATPNQKKLLKAHLEKMTVVADVSPSDYSGLDTELHKLLAQFTQNNVFSVVDAALAPIFSRTTNQWLKQHMELQHDQSAIHLQHTEIVEAIAVSNGEDASAAMQEHLAYVLRNLRHLRELDHLHEIATARRLLS